MKPFIAEIPADEFFPVRYSVDRGDGNRTHPCIDREWPLHIMAKAADLGSGNWAIARRDKPGKPWAKAGTTHGSCQADAEHRAWLMGLTPSEHLGEERLWKVFHCSEWAAVQAKQHLKAIGIKPALEPRMACKSF